MYIENEFNKFCTFDDFVNKFNSILLMHIVCEYIFCFFGLIGKDI